MRTIPANNANIYMKKALHTFLEINKYKTRFKYINGPNEKPTTACIFLAISNTALHTESDNKTLICIF